jgi:radical SAM protein with 4Fe4S-binding SPASM domain
MKNYCPNADQGLMLMPNGDVTPCCIIGKMPKFNIKENGFKDYFESEWYKEFVATHHRDDRHAACRRCYDAEDEGIKSKRQLDIEKLSDSFVYDKRAEPPIKNFEMTFGNLCNLACRICFPFYSSKWATEKGKIEDKKYPIYTWHQDKEIMKSVVEAIKEVERITIVGGEPFLTEIKEHQDFLQHFTDTGQAKKMTLHYTTNGTTFPAPDVLDLLKNFKGVDIQISIDGIGDQFEYNRWPGKWDQLYPNIKKYQKLADQMDNLVLSVSHTISAFTIYYVEEFVLWCLREKLPFPYFNQLLYSIHNRASVFPERTKILIRKKLLQSKSPQIKKLVAWLDYADDSDSFGKFEDQIKIYDNIRKQKFDDVFPELRSIL